MSFWSIAFRAVSSQALLAQIREGVVVQQAACVLVRSCEGKSIRGWFLALQLAAAARRAGYDEAALAATWFNGGQNLAALESSGVAQAPHLLHEKLPSYVAKQRRWRAAGAVGWAHSGGGRLAPLLPRVATLLLQPPLHPLPKVQRAALVCGRETRAECAVPRSVVQWPLHPFPKAQHAAHVWKEGNKGL